MSAAAIWCLVPKVKEPSGLAAVFERAGVPCRISENIAGELWTKLIWNCALNAISALGRVKYGQIAASNDARQIVRSLVEEILGGGQRRGDSFSGFDRM